MPGASAQSSQSWPRTRDTKPGGFCDPTGSSWHRLGRLARLLAALEVDRRSCELARCGAGKPPILDRATLSTPDPRNALKASLLRVSRRSVEGTRSRVSERALERAEASTCRVAVRRGGTCCPRRSGPFPGTLSLTVTERGDAQDVRAEPQARQEGSGQLHSERGDRRFGFRERERRTEHA